MFANTLEKKRKTEFSTGRTKGAADLKVIEETHVSPVDVMTNLNAQTDGAVQAETVISHDLVIEGHVTSKGTVRLEGTLIGNMSCASFIVEERGIIKGNIISQKVDVYGEVEGMVTGKNVQLHASALVEGDIYHQGIGIEMGAQYDGRLRRVEAADEGNQALQEQSTPVAAAPKLSQAAE